MDLLPMIPDDDLKFCPSHEIEADSSAPAPAAAEAQARPIAERVLRKLRGLSNTLDEIDEWLESGVAARAGSLAGVGSVGSCELTLDHLDVLFAFERRRPGREG